MSNVIDFPTPKAATYSGMSPLEWLEEVGAQIAHLGDSPVPPEATDELAEARAMGLEALDGWAGVIAKMRETADAMQTMPNVAPLLAVFREDHRMLQHFCTIDQFAGSNVTQVYSNVTAQDLYRDLVEGATELSEVAAEIVDEGGPTKEENDSMIQSFRFGINALEAMLLVVSAKWNDPDIGLKVIDSLTMLNPDHPVHGEGNVTANESTAQVMELFGIVPIPPASNLVH